MEFGDPIFPERFWNKIQVDEETGCWIWIGSVKGKQGSDRKYAVYTHNGKPSSLTLVVGGVVFPGYNRERERPVNTCSNSSICAQPKHYEIRVKPKYKCTRGGHVDPERDKAGRCIQCRKENDKARPPRPSGPPGKKRRKPVAKAIEGFSVFGDKSPGEIWRPEGWPKEVLGGKLSA